MVVLVVLVVITMASSVPYGQVVLVGEGQVADFLVVVEVATVEEEVVGLVVTLPRTKRSAVEEEVLILPHRPRIPRCLWKIRGMAW